MHAESTKSIRNLSWSKCRSGLPASSSVQHCLTNLLLSLVQGSEKLPLHLGNCVLTGFKGLLQILGVRWPFFTSHIIKEVCSSGGTEEAMIVKFGGNHVPRVGQSVSLYAVCFSSSSKDVLLAACLLSRFSAWLGQKEQPRALEQAVTQRPVQGMVGNT